jgi:hypothetical protein
MPYLDAQPLPFTAPRLCDPFSVLITILLKFSYGGKIDDYPHPELEFDLFLRKIESKNATAGMTWDPIDKRDKHWIDTKKLTAAYGKHGCTIS